MKNLYSFLSLFLALFLIAGCSDDDSSTNPIDESLNPPSNLKVSLSANPGGGSIAQITWISSTSEVNNNFSGYVVITDTVTENGVSLGTVDSTFLGKSESDFINISSLERGKYYKTSIYSLGNDGRKSNTAETIVYAGVYSNLGTIDEFSTYQSAQSGFAWDNTFFGGTQLSFSASNFNKIDMHARAVNDELSFVSPKSVDQSARQTFYEEVPGTGEAAYELAESLPEPTKTSIKVEEDKVYLLKTQENYYIKVWVKSIVTGNYKTISFEYKAQPIEGFKVLKR